MEEDELKLLLLLKNACASDVPPGSQIETMTLEELCALCMKRCNHFDYCNAPKCPLDPRMDIRIELPGEDKCDLSKNKRRKLAIGWPLPYQGMTKREFAGYTKWQNMPQEDKDKIIGQIKK